MMVHDDDVLYSDADIEMWEISEISNAIRQATAEGICPHTSVVGYLPEPVYPAQVGLRPGQSRCNDGCGVIFDSDEEWIATMMDVIS
jgi:hypothetical protein